MATATAARQPRSVAPEETTRMAEDVTWLLNCGESPAEVARRMETTPSGLARRFYAAQLHDLATPFEREYQMSRAARRAGDGCVLL